ncbi:MAG: PAS domain-containing protein [Alphaproteobacteria bacterium]|nr:PAS domain-containing protein [Alphaproteobacteria bacterium]MBU0797277.1 PAS domain-containing protein [Alphaproteobacteria bacterium]MBU0888935.1 PAS domain-containing protein [Alphaproteobacteria bacterium]MBU1813955.1 PAS domain-containing protein [Alphaproteobacteria bacterium]MBU2089291.1 PAS domain-containing protein [Alphaproteobacteria bacterium]
MNKADIGHPRLRNLYDYWERCRGDRLLPARSDLDPVDIPALLSNLILIDVERGTAPDGGMRFRFRLYGTEVCKIRGADLTGRYIDEPGITYLREVAIRSYEKIVTDRAPVYEAHAFPLSVNFVGTYHRLVLPLAADGANVDMLLIGFYREIPRLPAAE